MPRSAYNLWMKQTGPALLSMHGASFKNVGERSRYLAIEWKKVSSEEKTRCGPSIQGLGFLGLHGLMIKCVEGVQKTCIISASLPHLPVLWSLARVGLLLSVHMQSICFRNKL